MSVINQMLRDLEQRKLKETSSEHYIDEVNIVARRRTVSLWWIILPLIIIIVVAINWYLYFLNSNKSSLSVIEQKAKITQSITESTVPDLPEKITDIKPETVTTPLEVQEVNDNNKPAVTLNKIVKQEPPAETVIEQSQKTVSIASDKTVTETIDEINKQVLEPEKTLSRAIENKSPIIKQALQEKKNSDNLSLNAQVKLPVKIQAKRFKKNTPINAEKIVNQARLLMADDQAKAMQLLENNINKVSPNADYYALLANLKQRRHNYDSAIVYYRKALEIAPDKGEIWIGIALAFQGTGEEKNSINAFKQALTSGDLTIELRAYARQQIGL